MNRCMFEGCDRPVDSRGLCQSHYLQKRRGGQLRPLQHQIHGASEEERFRAHTAAGSVRECWTWNASCRPDGYGQWRRADGKIELAHRASWRLFRTEIPAGAHILHKCDNPSCVNPTHLFLGSHADNMRDMWGKGRARPGRSMGEKHGMAKLTAEIVQEIRSSGESGVELARKFGLAATTVCDVRKRRTWKHID
ncbi:endonuclease [Caudoviricetes sp.]|nr:endonuclease [Caudoviricetes sp.]